MGKDKQKRLRLGAGITMTVSENIANDPDFKKLVKQARAVIKQEQKNAAV